MKKIILPAILLVLSKYSNAQTLQQVTDAGNVTTKGITVNAVESTGGYTRYYNNGSLNSFMGSDHSAFGQGGNDAINYVYGNNKFHIATNNTRRLTVDGNGFVGIGTTTPAYTLDVNGTSRFTQFLHLTSNNQEVQFYRNGSVYGYLWSTENGLHWGKGAAGNSINVDNQGNVGIGTATPTYKLEVQGGSNVLRLVGNNSTSSSPSIDIYDNVHGTEFVASTSAGKVDLFSYGNHPLALGAANSEKMRILPDGNVGIGTPNPVPIGPAAYTLGINSVNDSYSGGVSYMANGVVKGYTYFDFGAMTLQGASGVPIKFMTNNTEVVRLTTGGNFGIGTMVPEARLSVKNIDAYEIATFNSSATGGYLTFKTADQVRGYLQYGLTLAGSANGNNVLLTNIDHGGSIALQTKSASGIFNTNALIVNSSGDVGIGTSATTPDYKLTVAGKMHSREVKVSIDAGADFVFEKNYNLKPLIEVSEFISANKHLPEVATADEMKKNGLELGEMNIKLLQKVEELTLYLIEQNKDISELKKSNQELKEKMSKIKIN